MAREVYAKSNPQCNHGKVESARGAHHDRLPPISAGDHGCDGEFIAGLGSTAAWPVLARAQQSAMPVIGYLGSQSADDNYKNFTIPSSRGLKEAGHVEGQNVAVEYRWAENQYDRLPALAADLVRHHVAVKGIPLDARLERCFDRTIIPGPSHYFRLI
jgi:hypothetical protein